MDPPSAEWTRLGAGLYLDQATDHLHFYPRALCEEVGLPPTVRYMAMAIEVMRDLVRLKFPDAQHIWVDHVRRN